MNLIIKVVKVGNHWYPNLQHSDPKELILDRKLEILFTRLDCSGLGELTFLLSEVHSWMTNDVIQFDENDIVKWITSDKNFDLTVYIGDHDFKVSSVLLDLFETQFNTNFHKNLYSINLE